MLLFLESRAGNCKQDCTPNRGNNEHAQAHISVMKQDKEARLAYELALGKRVSDVHWWRTKKLLALHELPATITNLQLLVKLRRLVPKSAVGVSGLLEAYSRAEKVTSKLSQRLTGGEISNILAQQGILPHRTTLGRWFKKAAGGYKKKREYNPEEIKKILISAFLWKASQPNRLPKAS